MKSRVVSRAKSPLLRRRDRKTTLTNNSNVRLKFQSQAFCNQNNRNCAIRSAKKNMATTPTKLGAESISRER